MNLKDQIWNDMKTFGPKESKMMGPLNLMNRLGKIKFKKSWDWCKKGWLMWDVWAFITQGCKGLTDVAQCASCVESLHHSGGHVDDSSYLDSVWMRRKAWPWRVCQGPHQCSPFAPFLLFRFQKHVHTYRILPDEEGFLAVQVRQLQLLRL